MYLEFYQLHFHSSHSIHFYKNYFEMGRNPFESISRFLRFDTLWDGIRKLRYGENPYDHSIHLQFIGPIGTNLWLDIILICCSYFFFAKIYWLILWSQILLHQTGTDKNIDIKSAHFIIARKL